ncbi:MAG: glutamate synthase large subunit [Cryobacterium sp.]|nr:glutamate synthase large subunit [Cryobacterium sp.]
MPVCPLNHRYSAVPAKTGLYDPAFEKDACGIAMVATLRGSAGHDIVELALNALRNLEHRGAVGADEGTGDGAGILIQLPDTFLRNAVEFKLPPAGHYGTGIVFLPQADSELRSAREQIHELARIEGLTVLGWRQVPIDLRAVGKQSTAVMPAIHQIFVGSPGDESSGIELERRLFRLRSRAERSSEAYFCSLSGRTMIFKGMVTALQLGRFYRDLAEPSLASRFAIVHSRFSTNTFPSWPLAQPFRMIAHNGEINTIQGNRNWMRARQSQLSTEVLGNIDELFPIITPGGSDSAAFDEVFELLTLAGRSLPHAMLMMIPEAFENDQSLPQSQKDFYEYHSVLMEPWDGPAAIIATDGRLIGATLDRNGLRPGRFMITDSGLVVLASEAGVIKGDESTVVRKGRLSPGNIFLVDTEAGRIIEDQEIKESLSAAQPWGKWLEEGRINLRDLPEREHVVHTSASVTRRQRTFGYTEEELRVIIEPMARTGVEPVGAMGSDTPIAALSDRPRLLFDYFTQQFAQVTNPPLDSIREEIVTSMKLALGPERNLLTATPEHAFQIVLDFPVLNNDELAKIQHIDASPGNKTTTTVRGLYRVDDGPRAMQDRLSEICREVDEAISQGAKYLILSDRESNREFAPIPSLLLLSAVHHHLIRQENRLKVGIIVEAGDVREVHHAALLIGYGASAVNPYLAMESAEELVRRGIITEVSAEEAVANIIRALGKGILKTMSKMGISVVSSYAGAQAFEAIGLAQEFVDEYFEGTVSRLGGVGIEVIAEENLRRHQAAYPDQEGSNAHLRLPIGGEYQWRRGGPAHLFNPETVFRLQHSTRQRRFDIFRQYSKLVDDQSESLKTIRGLFRLNANGREPIPIEDVEPASEIIRRFSTGAMSYGSISQEAHETLAIAMNRLGAKSNTGEGGESLDRLEDPARCSAIKQVASARFGVTSLYLNRATDIQIKMAQGAKPGEGGQLPSEKVYPWIAETRNSTPGVGLISPPPHHDIYSIEDLKQLIFDLKRANPKARIQVKLVSQSGIGAVAAGVVKAKADVVLVSGHDGGTGASPLSSLKHAGTPWEIGLAEAQQTLTLDGLRDRIVLQVDGQLKTGRDVIIAAALGAEEFGFATAPLVVSGCVMMRVCHLDTCPVGVATQNPELRARFSGKPEFVENFFEFLAEEVRGYLAELGYRRLDDIVGRTEIIDASRAVSHWKADGLNLEPILKVGDLEAVRHSRDQDHELQDHFDNQLVRDCDEVFASGMQRRFELAVSNTDRAVGALLGHEVTRRMGAGGLPEGTIGVSLRGTAGQSLGAFLPSGITIRLEGEANDYLAKGLSGGRIIVSPDRGSVFPAERNVIAGNVIGYGATSGEIFIRGVVGERFLVRNSGAVAVVEGVGDHALEYMTGGVAVILGSTGRNLAAGMSGGMLFLRKFRPERVNRQALDSGELLIEDLEPEDIQLLSDLLERHLNETGSVLAERMLSNRSELGQQFVKLIPRGFKAVTGAQKEFEHSGLDPLGPLAWERILEVAHG